MIEQAALRRIDLPPAVLGYVLQPFERRCAIRRRVAANPQRVVQNAVSPIISRLAQAPDVI
jgi:hypothetical protein